MTKNMLSWWVFRDAALQPEKFTQKTPRHGEKKNLPRPKVGLKEDILRLGHIMQGLRFVKRHRAGFFQQHCWDNVDAYRNGSP
jgi:hypothetical protein